MEVARTSSLRRCFFPGKVPGRTLSLAHLLARTLAASHYLDYARYCWGLQRFLSLRGDLSMHPGRILVCDLILKTLFSLLLRSFGDMFQELCSYRF